MPSKGKSAQPVAAPAPDQGATAKVELDIVRDYDQRLLSTVYWSLSGVFLLVVLVGGLNWFTNYRMYERERDSLRESLKLAAQEEAIKLRSLVEQLQDQLRGEVEHISKRVAAFETNTDKLLSEREKGVRGMVEASVKSAKKDLEREVAHAELGNSETRAAFYSAANQPWQVLGAWVDNLQALEKLDWLDENFIGRALDGIEACLQKDITVSYQQHSELKRILQRAPEVLAARTMRTLARLDNMKHV